MARIPTSWANNDVKPATAYTPVTKTQNVWNAPAAKSPTAYVGIVKSTDKWAPHTPKPQTYFYNDPNMTYNNLNVEYDYLVNGNTDNQRLVSRWSNS